MARQFGVIEDVAYTCETAGYFWLLHVLSRWEKFMSQCSSKKTTDCVADLFPFKEYFAGAPQPIFGRASYEKVWAEQGGGGGGHYPALPILSCSL